jgi:phosphatidylglycerophosphate synthase
MSAPAANSPFNLPNLLSLSRLPLGWLFWVVLGPTPVHGALALGVMARPRSPTWPTAPSPGGRPRRVRYRLLAGSICDKLFVGAVLAALHFERGVSFRLLALSHASCSSSR